MASIFDEDSSSDEDQPAPPAVDRDTADQGSAPALNDAQEASRKLVIGDDDEEDDDDDDDGVGRNDKEGGQSNKVVYNPDEEDVEFDGDGGIVGSAARPKPALMSTNGSPRKSHKPNHMTVLETDRPESNVSLHMVKLPNIVGIQTEAFDPDTYSSKIEEEEFNGFVPNMIRWRYKTDEDGNFLRDSNSRLLRESNTRVVKWDDGSYSLHIGKEVFQVDTIDSTQPNGYPGLNGYLYLSQTATFRNNGDNEDDDDEEETPGGTVLECMGGVQSKLVPRPSSLQSEAHKSLTVAVRQKTIQRARIAQYVTQEDPEKAKEARIKNKDELEKVNARKNARSSYTPRPSMNRRYMERHDDRMYDDVGIDSLKRGGYGDEDEMDYGVDSEGDDDEDDRWRAGRLGARKRQQQKQRQNHGFAVESEDDEEEFAIGEESDDEAITRTKPNKKRAHQAVMDDDED